MFNNIYSNKRVFLTGHTGFKGCWLALWLTLLGAKVCGYSLAPNTNPSMFEVLNAENKIEKSIIGDILDNFSLEKAMLDFKPDIVFHLAAQPLVRLSYSEPVLTYQTNVIGTLNVLEAARKCKSVKAFVNVTTDKCYENKEINRGYREDEPMGGYDMYSSSKGCVEIMSSSYRRSFLQNENSYAMATARAGNVIGGGDWALDRLIPDCIRSINNNEKIEIRNSVLKVSDVVKKVIEFYGKGEVVIHKKDNLHEAGLLMLNIDKARKVLNWKPTYTPEEAIEKTVDWYKHFYSNDKDLLDYTLCQISDYAGLINWA